MDRRDAFAAAMQRFKGQPMGLVNPDEVPTPAPDSPAFHRYSLAPCVDPVIDEYFRHVAKMGRAMFEWKIVRSAFLWKLEAVMRQMRKMSRERSGSFSRPSSHGSAGDVHRDASVSPKPGAGSPRPLRHTSPAVVVGGGGGVLTTPIATAPPVVLGPPTGAPPSKVAADEALRLQQDEANIMRIVETAADFDGIPFTFQRLCELLTEPRRHYTKLDKYLRAVEKCVRVVTTVFPNGERDTGASAIAETKEDESMLFPHGYGPPTPPYGADDNEHRKELKETKGGLAMDQDENTNANENEEPTIDEIEVQKGVRSFLADITDAAVSAGEAPPELDISATASELTSPPDDVVQADTTGTEVQNEEKSTEADSQGGETETVDSVPMEIDADCSSQSTLTDDAATDQGETPMPSNSAVETKENVEPLAPVEENASEETPDVDDTVTEGADNKQEAVSIEAESNEKRRSAESIEVEGEAKKPRLSENEEEKME